MTLGSVVFLLSLVPTVLNPRSRVPFSTSLPTAIVLLAYCLTLRSLGLVVAPVLSVLTAGMWGFIALRRRVSVPRD